MQCVTKGVVIRAKSVGDDRLLTLLTEDYGVIQTSAKGANKPRSRLASSTEQFCYSRFTLFRYRDYNTVDSADIESSFFELRKDLSALGLASYISEICCELAPQEEEAKEYLRLLLNTLYMLTAKKKTVWFLKPLFELRLLTMAGFMPDLTGCRECGEFKAPAGAYFGVESGDFICSGCSSQLTMEEQGKTRFVSPAVLAAMRHIIYSDFEKLFSFTLADEAIRELNIVSELYLKHQVGREYKTLDFFYSVAQA